MPNWLKKLIAFFQTGPKTIALPPAPTTPVAAPSVPHDTPVIIPAKPPVGDLPKVILGHLPKLGESGTDVLSFQKRLIEKGALIKADGVFGSATANAVSTFQKSLGLPGSGEPGPKTLEALGVEIRVVNPVTQQRAITRDLKGKRENRHMHPTLRLMVENVVFPNGEIPQIWKDKNVRKCAQAVARAFLSFKILEIGGNNLGEYVGMIQGIIGTVNLKGTGDAWCMSTMQNILAFLEDYFQVESPVEDSEHCVTVFKAARNVPGLVAEGLEECAMFIGQHGSTSNGHTGFIDEVHDQYRMTTIEGNTSSGGKSGLFKKEQDVRHMGDLHLLGSVRFFPYNQVA